MATEFEKFRGHSILLNQILWRMADRLGDIGSNMTENFVEPQEIIDRFFGASPEPTAEAALAELVACEDIRYHMRSGLAERVYEEFKSRQKRAWEAARALAAGVPTPEPTDEQVKYPRDFFHALISGNSPYAFYIFQWVPYQIDAMRWRLKMQHDVITFDGREAFNIWPNGSSCGPFRDEEVEFIRISKSQFGEAWTDPRPDRAAVPPEIPPGTASGDARNVAVDSVASGGTRPAAADDGRDT